MKAPVLIRVGLRPAALLSTLLLLVRVPGGFAAQTNEAVGAGKEFIATLAREDYAAAVGTFDATMKGVMPEAKLREVWQGLQAQAGKFKSQSGGRVEKQFGYDIVFVGCDFERAELDAKIVFNPQKQVAGLFFTPRQAARPATLPAYVRTNAFRERDFTVGEGEWALPGTLTRPVGPPRTSAGQQPACPAVVLVHGSGPNDRDETIGPNKPFRDLAWGLASRGIAVLRYEKRTRQHAARLLQAGKLNLTVQEETVEDALKAAAQLRGTEGIDEKRVYLLGHSLGGMLAPRIAQGDPRLAGLVILAGATRPLEDLIVEQTRYLLSLHDTPSDADRKKVREVEDEAAKIRQLTTADADSGTLLLFAPPRYWLDLRAYKPAGTARTLAVPMLILQGGRDYQVTEADFNGWKEALGKNPKVTLKLYPKLNHLFMAGEGKSRPAEYESAGHVDEAVITDIERWINRPAVKAR